MDSPVITSLAELRVQKQLIKAQIEKEEKSIRLCWRDLTHKVPKGRPISRMQRFMSVFTHGATIVDLFLLGWKVYGRFHRH